MKTQVFMAHEVLPCWFQKGTATPAGKTVSVHQSTRRHNPGDLYIHQHSCVNLESPKTEAG